MANDLSLRSEKRYDAIQDLRENQLDALKSLALLLLREVESLQNSAAETSKVLDEENLSLYDRVQQFEEDLIRVALLKTNGNQRRAAKLLGTKETTLSVKIKRHRIDEANQYNASNNRLRQENS